MSITSTTVYLYIGYDNERRRTPGAEWEYTNGGHFELVDWMETMAIELDHLYDTEFAQLELSVVFDYDITEELGEWLYKHPDATEIKFAQEARRLVDLAKIEDDKRLRLWAENNKRLGDLDKTTGCRNV